VARKRVAILISGRGSNMSALIKAAKAKNYPAEIVLVLSNRPEAKGLELAKAESIPTAVIDHKIFSTREEFDAAIDAKLKAAKIEIVCLAGFMRVFTDDFVERWQAEPLFQSQTRLDEATRAAEQARRLGHSPEGLCHSLRVTGLAEMPNYWDRLGELRVPVRLLAGAFDARFCAIAAAIVGRLQSGHFAEIPEAGHNLLLERPELVASAILEGS